MRYALSPQATPYDPAEDAPGSSDPLGTVAIAEQLADCLLPGLLDEDGERSAAAQRCDQLTKKLAEHIKL